MGTDVMRDPIIRHPPVRHHAALQLSPLDLPMPYTSHQHSTLHDQDVHLRATQSCGSRTTIATTTRTVVHRHKHAHQTDTNTYVHIRTDTAAPTSLLYNRRPSAGTDVMRDPIVRHLPVRHHAALELSPLYLPMPYASHQPSTLHDQDVHLRPTQSCGSRTTIATTTRTVVHVHRHTNRTACVSIHYQRGSSTYHRATLASS